MPTCKHCRKKSNHDRRGLCRRCYDTPAVRHKYPDPRSAPRPDSGPRCAWAGCPYAARHGCRGLCTRCHKDPARRAARPDGTRKAMPEDAARRNAILCDPVVCPPGFLEYFAAATIKKFRMNPRIDKADLIQEGWLVLIRAAEAWDPDGPAKTLPVFARRALWDKMTRAARSHVTSATFGNSDAVESGRRFVPSLWARRAEDADTLRRLVRVTAHAVERYRERFDPSATAETVRRAVAKSVPADPWVKLAIEASAGTKEAGYARCESHLYLVHGETLIIVDNNGSIPVVITVLTMETQRANAIKMGILTR